MKKLLITAVFICVALLKANAQKKFDYIINLQGDTIKCTLKNVMFSSNPKFKTDTMAEYQKITAMDTKQYRRKKDKYPYRSVVLPKGNEPVFVQLVEEGKINLYQQIIVTSTYPYYSSTTYWYVQKGADTVRQIKSNSLFNGKSRKERQAEFANLLADNADVAQYYDQAKSFSFSTLQDIIRYYNTGIAPKREDEQVATTN